MASLNHKHMYDYEKEAKQYIIRRVELQQSAIFSVKDKMFTAIKKIVKIAKRYNIHPSKFSFSSNKKMKYEIDAVIEELLSGILNIVKHKTMDGIKDKEEKSKILLWLALAFKGKTLSQRLTKYLADWERELQPQVAAAISKRVSDENAAITITQSLSNARNSYLYRYALSKGYEGTTMNVGRVGTYRNAFNNISRAVSDQIARTHQQIYYDIRHPDAQKWLVMRGSRYPCSLCDSMCGVKQREDDLPPFHPNCCCIAIPIQ